MTFPRLIINVSNATTARPGKSPGRRIADTATATPPPADDADDLEPARGILGSVIAGCALWVLIGWVAWLIFR